MSSYFQNWRRFKKTLKKSRVAKRGRMTRSPHAQRLEDRRVLSITPPTLIATESTLVIVGGIEADTVVVSESPSGTIVVQQYELDQRLTTTFPKSSITSIEFYGAEGNDRFTNKTDIGVYAEGGDGDDTLISGAGADTLIGNAGDDRLEGGDGDDTLLGGAGEDVLHGNAGDDYLEGGTEDDTFYGGAGNDTIYGDAGDDYIDGGAGDDQLNGGLGNDYFLGGLGDDHLSGDGGNDRLEGGDGDDTLLGGAGADVLLGQNGVDLLDGGDDSDNLYGGEGNDFASGGSGNDYIDGGAGDDRISGGAGDDLLLGGLGNDYMLGESGDDRFEGGEGDDTLLGGAGKDVIHGDAGNDRIEGGEDGDNLYGDTGADTLLGDAGDDYIDGGVGDDTLEGGIGDDLLVGGLGDDHLSGDGGNDRLEGGDGDDTLLGGAGADVLLGQNGIDLLDGGDDSDNLYGGEGNDFASGGSGNDYIDGGAGDDRISGGAGDDLLLGGLGNDYMLGESGDDRFEGGEGDDTLLGGAGKDVIHGDAGNDRLEGGDDGDNLYGDAGIDTLYGGLGGDYLYGGEGNDLLVGGDDDDNMQGGAGADQLIGGSGNDRLEGGADSDLLFGGDGTDSLYGQAGEDFLVGGDQSDNLYGGDGDDHVYGGADNDYLDGGAGDDNLSGGLGNDLILGGLGDDILDGDAGRDRLEGGDGNDALLGGDDIDELVGGAGGDLLIGGAAADTLYGSGGDDILIGASTAYDFDELALRNAIAVWNNGLSYEERVAALTAHGAAVRFVAHETVFADYITDTLRGDSDQDWFVLSAFNGVYNPLGASDGGHGGGHSSDILLDSPPVLEGFALIDSMDQLLDAGSTEAVHSLMNHSGDPSKMREHLSLFQLVRYADVTHTAIASGDWSNPTTWENGAVPTAGARVLIPFGAHVTVDKRMLSELQTVRVDGTLEFATDANSELRVDTIVVTTAGALVMGTADAPIQPNVTAKLLITDSGPIDTIADPFLLGRGLITHGAVTMYGAAVTSFVASSGPIAAGSTTIRLASAPVGWKVGDEIAIAGASAGGGQDEVRVIRAISGRDIAIDPLNYDHVPLEAGLELHVANLTRNVVIESASNINSQRGHVMFMHNRDVHISYAAFNGLGRTDKSFVLTDPKVDSNWNLVEGSGDNPRARYAVHFHRNGVRADSLPATVQGSVVNGSPGWGYVNHSSYVDFTDNVSYGVNGAAFVAEAGDEIGSFDSNLALHTTGTSEDVDARVYRQDFGFNGDGFWLQSPGVSVTNNVVSGSTGSAYFYYSRGLRFGAHEIKFLAENLEDPAIAGGNESISVMHTPIKLFTNNVGYSSKVGLSVRYNLRDATHTAKSLLTDSVFWNNTVGVHLPYANNSVLQNLTVLIDPSAPTVYGVDNNSVTKSITFRDLRVEGYRLALHIPHRGSSVVEGGSFVSKEVNIIVRPADADGMQVVITGDPYFGGVDGVDVEEVAMGYGTTNAAGNPLHVFNGVTVLLDYGPYKNHQLFFYQQRPDAIPFPESLEGLPEEYVGLTQQELHDNYGLTIGGAIAPAEAFEVPSLRGLLAATSRERGKVPTKS